MADAKIFHGACETKTITVTVKIRKAKIFFVYTFFCSIVFILVCVHFLKKGLTFQRL